MEIAFGGRASTGIILTMLCAGDIFAVAFYRRHAELTYLVKLLPWTLAGLASGVFFGAVVSEGEFKTTLGVIILALLALMIPAIMAGAFLGLGLAGIIPERAYRIFLLTMTTIAAALLFLA